MVLHCGPDAVDPSNPSPGETFHLVSGVKCFNCVVVIIDPGWDGFIAIPKHALLHVVIWAGLMEAVRNDAAMAIST